MRSCPRVSMEKVHHRKRKNESHGPATSSQTHTFKPRLIFKDLVLEIIDLALEEVGLLVEAWRGGCCARQVCRKALLSVMGALKRRKWILPAKLPGVSTPFW